MNYKLYLDVKKIFPSKHIKKQRKQIIFIWDDCVGGHENRCFLTMKLLIID